MLYSTFYIWCNNCHKYVHVYMHKPNSRYFYCVGCNKRLYNVFTTRFIRLKTKKKYRQKINFSNNT